jgi:hypothetical protein
MVGRWSGILATLAMVVSGLPATGGAQPLGSFSWQLAPYCNLITASVTQDGGIYTLDGYDNQCGAAARAAVSGTAFVNPNGTIGIGLTTVTVPGGVAVHLEAAIDTISLGGAWHDSHGNSGTLIFSPASTAGPPRPLGAGDLPDGSITGAKLADGAVSGSKIADGSIGASDINGSEVQRRISASCPADQMMTAVHGDGTVTCAAGSGSGDITAVTAGAGLSGGGTSGAVSLAVAFDGSGTAPLAARSDHTHERPGGGVGVNTAVGRSALGANTTGGENTALGYGSLRWNTVGARNTAVGIDALRDTTEGTGNVAVGAGALDDNVLGIDNVALGNDALTNVTTGGQNVGIGPGAGRQLVSGTLNVYLGSRGYSAAESATIRIGNSPSQTRAFIAGIRGVTTGLADAVGVVIDSAGQLGTLSSSRRTKFDIAELGAGVTEALHRLRPVQFRYRQAFADGSTPIQYGLIAEEVNEVLPGLVAPGQDGTPETVKYHVLPSLLLADLQRLERERAALAEALETERRRVSNLEAQVRAIHDALGVSSTTSPKP